MLQQMREMKIFVFWFVAITFVVGFVFLSDGLNVGQLQSTDANVVVDVNGQKVEYAAYSRYVNYYIDMERQQSQRDELSSAEYDRIEEQAWNDMITDLLMRQEADKLGIRAADEEIVETLTQSPPPWVQQRFQDENGRFDFAAFQAAINDPSYDWGPDERALRQELPKAKLQQMVRARATVSEEEVRQEFARESQKITARYVGIRLHEVDLGDWKPSEAETRAFYDQHPERFRRGETVTLDIVRVAKKPSPDDEADALDDANEVQEELRRGEPFATLAEAYSDGPTAPRGGERGWVRADQLEPALRDAATVLAPGGTSAAVRTETGFYLLHADSVRTVSGAQEIKLREILLVPKISPETLDSLRTRVTQAAEAAQKNFEGAARDLGVPVQRVESVEKLGFISGIGYAKRLVDWAFSAAPGAVSTPFGTDDAILVAKLVAKNPEGPRPFEEVSAQVPSAVLENQRKVVARQRLERVLERVRGGMALDVAARAEGLQSKEPAPFTFIDNVPDVGSRNEFSAVALALEPGKTSDVVETSSGAYIIQVVSREPFDDTAYQARRQALYQNLLGRRQMEVYQAWIEELRERATIDDRRSPRV